MNAKDGRGSNQTSVPRVLNYRFALQSDFTDLYLLVDQCLDLQDMAIATLQERFEKGGGLDQRRIIVTFNHYKATDAFISTMKLVDVGLVGDAQATLRRLLEVAINMKFLWSNPDKTVPQYWHYMTLSLNKLIRESQKGDLYTEFLRKNLAKLAPKALENLELAKTHYEQGHTGKIAKKYSRSWSGLHLREMADKCGMIDDYLYCYKVGSISTHASIEDLGNYFNYKKVSFGPQFKVGTAMNVILESIRCYLIVLEITLKCYDLLLHDSVAALRLAVGKFREDPRLRDE